MAYLTQEEKLATRKLWEDGVYSETGCGGQAL